MANNKKPSIHINVFCWHLLVESYTGSEDCLAKFEGSGEEVRLLIIDYF